MQKPPYVAYGRTAFNPILSARMGELGFNISSLAEAAGVNMKTVSKVRRGGRAMPHVIEAIARALGVQPEYIGIAPRRYNNVGRKRKSEGASGQKAAPRRTVRQAGQDGKQVGQKARQDGKRSGRRTRKGGVA
jgi:lambda repressor-like predicted transcriptional regulator